jgi:DNA-binding Lrp family transcriptional regulator
VHSDLGPKNPDSTISFEKRQEIEAAYETRKRGVQLVKIDRILGSVGRYDDFDRQFRPRPHLPSERFETIRKLMQEGKALPPVKLFQIKDDYYVMDGNHRVAAARALGWSEIHAQIVELIPSRNSLENILYRERREFEDRTGISDAIVVTEIGQYELLIKQIEDHRIFLETQDSQSVSFEGAARDWYETIYRPMTRLIQQVRLKESFPGRTVADLYAYICYHQWELGRKRTYGIGIDELIPKEMEAFREKMEKMTPTEYPEMQRWIMAFVLMTVQGRRENKIIEKLFALPEVREVHSVHGAFDIIAKILLSRDLLCSDAEIISHFVHEKIRMISGINSTQTLIPGHSRIKE